MQNHGWVRGSSKRHLGEPEHGRGGNDVEARAFENKVVCNPVMSSATRQRAPLRVVEKSASFKFRAAWANIEATKSPGPVVAL